MKYLVVRNFAKLQHYTKRSPPWIKLYNRLLDDPEFLALPTDLQRHLVMAWLFASRHEGRVPAEEPELRLAIKARAKIDIAALIDGGWLIAEEDATADDLPAKRVQDASTLQAKRSAVEKETEKERETEREGERSRQATTTTAREPELLARFAPEFQPDVQTLLDRVAVPTRRSAWCANLLAKLDGMHPPIATAEQVGQAIRDFNANDGTNTANFRGYLAKAMAPPPPPRPPRPASSNDAPNDDGPTDWDAVARRVEIHGLGPPP